MDIDYELIAVYSENDEHTKTAKKEFEHLFEDSYVEVQEVREIAVKYNAVVLYEFTESKGYSEVLLINNKGQQTESVNFCLDDIASMRKASKHKNIFENFDPTIQKKIINHMNAHKIVEKQFTEEYLDELFLDNYETKKDLWKDHIKDYYVK